MATVRNPFEDLESNNPAKVEEFKANIKEQFNKTKDPWIMNGVFDYYMKTLSLRAVDVMAMVNEPHDKFFFDRTLEGLKGQNKLQHLTLLGHLVRRNPMWLYKIFEHNLLKTLLFILKNESDIVVIVSALLILNILIPLVPRLVGDILSDIFTVFSKLAALNTKSTDYQDVQLVHLQISLYTLFHRLYGMFPSNFISFLRKEYMTTATYPVFSHTVKPMLDTVRFNHLLISGNEEWEKSKSRWNNIESHDIIMSCANLLMSGPGSSYKELEQLQRVGYTPKSSFNCKNLLDALRVTDKQTVAEYCKELGKGADDPTLFSPSVRFMKNGSNETNSAPIPLTPITRGYEVSSPYSEHEGSSPPEAAVEATPETTPVPDRPTTASPSGLISAAKRPLTSLIIDNIQQGATVPIADRSFPGSPIKKESSPIRYSAPEILLYSPSQPTSTRKIETLLADRNNQVNEDYYAVETTSILSSTIRITNDLNSENSKKSVISSTSKPILEDGISDKDKNGTTEVDKYDIVAGSVDDFGVCDLEKSGSPCSSGGLHMPDSKSLCNFAIQMKHMRSRHFSQCNSDSERFSPGSSLQETENYFKNSKVRRTNSCPEMKKSSPNSTTFSSDSPVLEEPDENEEFGDLEKGISARRRSKKSASTKVTVNIETQTDDLDQFPYEHLFLDVFPPLHRTQPDEQASPTESVNSLEERSPASVFERVNTPSKLLQKYIDAASQCYDDKVAIRENPRTPSIVLENKFLLDQLRLMGVQLQLEEHRREIHAERNRRLFHRSRRNKTLEEHNAALINQVKTLQNQLEICCNSLVKLAQDKKTQLDTEQKNTAYWRNEFNALQEEHKIVTSRCQKVEALLKEEKDLNEQNLKQLNENKAVLGDITNDLKTYQKDAMEVKELRFTVAELQYEIIKAGELITLYSNRLLEAHLPVDDKNEVQNVIDACSDEKKKFNTIIREQQIALDATRKVLSSLRVDVGNKENQVTGLDQELRVTRESLQNTIQDWQKKYVDLKELHKEETERSKKLELQVDRTKLILKSNQRMIPPQKEMTLRRGMIPLVEDGSGPSSSGSKSSQSVPKSPKNIVHSAQQCLKTAQENSDVIPTSEANRVRTSPVSEQSKERESPSRAKVETISSPTTFVAREPSVDGDSKNDVFKPITKRKARTECAETGQLRPISFTQFDPEPSPKKE